MSRDRLARTRIARRGGGEAGGLRRPVSEAQVYEPGQGAAHDGRSGRSVMPGRHVPGWRSAQVGYIFVLAVCAGGLGWMWGQGIGGVRGGTLAMSGAMFVASAARLVLPESRLGMIASRKRVTDVITLATLAGGLLGAGLALPMSP